AASSAAMSLARTAQATLELSNRERTLPLKDRAVLLLADGRKSAHELAALVRCSTEDVLRLVTQGYLAAAAPQRTRPAPSDPSAPAPAPAASPASTFGPSTLSPTAPAPVAVDRFEGPRSLATARMFLFDIVERLFARRAPEQADTFRQRLREARERDAMLAVARDLLEAVETVAGFERADHIAERLARMLPDEVTPG
ncbi:MAG TPA: hypothetical protein VFY35_02595, partial [Burkholderiaceae bacterium]|nr:hypothetical protein [Burkholderiaceae bacterium]